MLILSLVWAVSQGMVVEMPKRLVCQAFQSAGFHDYPNNPAGYESVVFVEGAFTLKSNAVLNQNLTTHQGPTDFFVTLSKEDEVEEMSCTRVKGSGGRPGLSCLNNPPAQMLLLNLNNLRFTRSAVGGWTFSKEVDAGAGNTEGESIFVEYGQCSRI